MLWGWCGVYTEVVSTEEPAVEGAAGRVPGEAGVRLSLREEDGWCGLMVSRRGKDQAKQGHCSRTV